MKIRFVTQGNKKKLKKSRDFFNFFRIMSIVLPQSTFISPAIYIIVFVSLFSNAITKSDSMPVSVIHAGVVE